MARTRNKDNSETVSYERTPIDDAGSQNIFNTDGTLVSFRGPKLNEPDTFAVSIQVLGAKAVVAAGGTVKYLIEYWLGNAKFRTALRPIRNDSVIRGLVTASRIRVQIQALAAGGLASPPGPPTCIGSVGYARGGTYQGPAGGIAQWYQEPFAAAALAAFYQFPDGTTLNNNGFKIYGATVNLVALAAGVAGVYALVLDENAGPFAGDIPVPGGRSTLMTLANPSSTFGGTEGPLITSAGCLVALSTTPDVFTAPAGGCTFTCDLLAGDA